MRSSTSEQVQGWAERITKSDRKAFDALFRAFYPRLVSYAWRFTQNKAVASDLAQDAFVLLWQNRHKIDPQRSLKGYLYTLVRNRALNYKRDYLDRTAELDPINQDTTAVDDDTEQETDTAPLLEKLREWVGELPDRRREAFELSRYEGLDHEEIAEIMDVSINTVNNHLVAALKFLKSRYKAYKETK